jgi:hypothetical protein
MEPIEAYHVNDISKIKSIVVDGLVPTYGRNSKENEPLHCQTFFGIKRQIDEWIRLLKHNEERVVVLKFICSNYNRRIGYLGDYFTSESYKPEELSILIGDKEIPLLDYYEQNKKQIEDSLEKAIVEDIEAIKRRLESIEKPNKDEQDPWAYPQTEPNTKRTLEMLKKMRYLDDKQKYLSIINEIREKTLMLLLNNDLDITLDSEVYKSISNLFADSMQEKPTIDKLCFEYASIIICANLYLRELSRYRKTRKHVSDENREYVYDNLDLDVIQNVFNRDDFIALLNETNELAENKAQKL